MAEEKLGPPLDIDKFLGKAKNRIHLIGVELEGGWFKPHVEYPPQRDGSIHFNLPTDDPLVVQAIRAIGEIPLPPLTLTQLPPVIKLYYPNYVNNTCGMHVHLSTVKAFSYQRLMINQPFSYPGTIVEYLRRWAKAERFLKSHPIWDRLDGKSEFCQHVFHADQQAKTSNKDFDHHRPGHRYTVIGYCWSRCKTLECRVLPMMQTSDQAIRAVQEVVNITNAFLAASREREQKYRSIIGESNDIEIYERKSYA